MNLLRCFVKYFQDLKHKKAIQLLRTVDPEAFMRWSEKKTVAAFHRAARRVPAYAKLLRSLQVNPAAVTDIEGFKELVPCLDKYNTFQAHEIPELCLDGNLDGVKSLLTSSGHSGVFSFGVNTVQNLKDSSGSIDAVLDYMFASGRKRTLLINCLPMGVKVNTRLVIAETSVREDMVWAVVKKFSHHYEQTILVGEGSFLKKIVEDGAEQHGIDWKSGVFHFVSGEEGIGENYRSYMANLAGVDFEKPDGSMFGSSMGVAELDLNIFHETPQTILIRRRAHQDPVFRKALFGENMTVCPMLFVYHPHRTYVEEVAREDGRSELVISMLSPHLKIPLIRYRSGDFGRVLPYRKVQGILRDFGMEQLLPDLKLPLAAVSGRGHTAGSSSGRLSPEEVKEALYADFSVASVITGAFKLIHEKSGLTAHIQLRKGKAAPDAAEQKVCEALRSFTPVTAKIVFYPYDDFPYFMELDYERKFGYL